MTSAAASVWNPHFVRASPMFAAYAPIAARWADLECFPNASQCAQSIASNATAVTNRSGRALCPEAPVPGAGASDFERAVAGSGALALRDGSWHDLLNLLVWCVFPRAKAALNAAHVDDIDRSRPTSGGSSSRPTRSALRDALTLFDENGVVVISADASLDRLLREFRWRELFVERRIDVVRSMRFVVFGHGLLDKARAPYLGLTGHACILPAAPAWLALEAPALATHVDAALARELMRLRTPRDLSPLPILGVPGWWQANEAPAFYENDAYFRPGRHAPLRVSRA
ncbi:MAG: DUF3025 domain-containing protein [Proteobacteria bacterium]|nr:DUF3025 domain-containing protein [Burkholderiales bacterium]